MFNYILLFSLKIDNPQSLLFLSKSDFLNYAAETKKDNERIQLFLRFLLEGDRCALDMHILKCKLIFNNVDSTL